MIAFGRRVGRVMTYCMSCDHSLLNSSSLQVRSCVLSTDLERGLLVLYMTCNLTMNTCSCIPLDIDYGFW